MKKAVVVISITLVGIAIVGAWVFYHKNPLINEDMISSMKAKFFLDGSDFPISECAKFYSGHGENSMKAKCDKWTENYYKGLFNTGGIPSTTTIENFRDSAFWKKVNPI